MIHVTFHDGAEDSLLKFAVIAAKSEGKWVFCKHRERDTLECPGGHREPGEKIDETARRELYEETGAAAFDIRPICVYAVERDGSASYGKLYYADITAFEPLPEMEIEKICLMDGFPEKWTYPDIQPRLMKKAEAFCGR